MTDSNLTASEANTPTQLQSVENPFKQTEGFVNWDQSIDNDRILNDFYMDDDELDIFKDNSEDPTKKVFRQAGGIGLEIGSGLGLDIKTAPLLAAPFPGARPLYFLINFAGGAAANLAAQKARGEKNIDYGEMFSAGSVQMVPFGSAGKGAKGIAGAALQGSTTAVADQQIQKAINQQEFLTPKEFLGSATFGAGFGTVFKGSIDGLQGLYTKYAGKSAAEINRVITPDEIKQVNKIVKDGKAAQKQQAKQKPSKKKKQDLGDPELTPNQYTNTVTKSENFGLIEELIRIKKLNKAEGTSPIKSQYAMKLGGLNLFDDGIIALSKTKRIKEYTKIYAILNDIAPSEDLAVALTQAVALATDEVVNANTRYINALNLKDFDQIEKAIDDLDKAFLQVDDWLGLSLPGRTTFGRTGQALQMQADSGIAGKSVDEVMNMSQAQRREAAAEVGDVTLALDERADAVQKLKKDLNAALKEAKESGDFTKLYKVGNTIQQTNGDVQKIVALEKHQVIPGLLNKTASIVNEIGINALMSAPGTNEVNLISGILNTYLNAFKLALGSRSQDEIEAAMRHFIALHSNFNFARKAYARSFAMEDNFINMGTSKLEVRPQDRYQISTTNTDWPSRIGINWTGKAIRLPSRLMTSTDALVQAPNLIGYATMEAFMHAKKIGLKGKNVDGHINKHINTIIEHLLSNGKSEITDKVTQKILDKSRQFSKSITFTNDIRTESLFGKGANAVDKFARNPLARLHFSFTRTPSNLISAGFGLTPGIGTPLTVKGQNINLLNEVLASEVRHDLLSPDPLIAQRARGGMNLAQGFGLTIAGMSMYYGNKFLEEDYVPPRILTGGGPDWKTSEGKAMWKAMYKNGWRPYSEGFLQYNEDGSPKFINGEPVYNYKSYDNIGLDPVSQIVGMMVDFVNSSGFINGKPFDDFTIGWTGVLSRNIFNKSYTSQINEFMQLITAFPSLVEDSGEFGNANPLKDYRKEKAMEYLGKQTVSRIIPFSNLLARFKTIPGDILEMMGYSRDDERIKQYIQKVDTKVRPGDVINQNLSIEDENFNKEQQLLKQLRILLNQAQEKTPGYNADLPFMYEHGTDEPILYPYKKGLDLFSLRKHSTSKNYKIYQALKLIGRQLPEPKDVITGGYSKQEFEPKKLNTKEYAVLRKFINKHIPKGEKYGNKTLIQAWNQYLNSKDYEVLSKAIETNGLTSEKGQIAAKEIYSQLYRRNNYYIKSGETEFFLQVLGEKEIEKRRGKKAKIKQEFFNEIENDLMN